jgi:hypothetical protein
VFWFVLGAFFGAGVLFAARTQDTKLQKLEEAIQKRSKSSKPIIIDGNDPVQELIDDEFNAVKE